MTETHRSNDTYSRAFQTFLRCTDEKKIILGKLTKLVLELSPRSILDIGAGSGGIAIPLSKRVPIYVAVEQRADFTAKLIRAGIETINLQFPCHIGERFSMVLLCHSLPVRSEEKDKWKLLVTKAWERVERGGFLSIVTFDDEDSDWSELLKCCSLGALSPKTQKLASLRAYLYGLGIVQEDRFCTFVRSTELRDVLQALAFVWSDGKEELFHEFMGNKAVAQYVRNRFRTDGSYYFPFEHIFLNVFC